MTWKLRCDPATKPPCATIPPVGFPPSPHGIVIDPKPSDARDPCRRKFPPTQRNPSKLEEVAPALDPKHGCAGFDGKRLSPEARTAKLFGMVPTAINVSVSLATLACPLRASFANLPEPLRQPPETATGGALFPHGQSVQLGMNPPSPKQNGESGCSPVIAKVAVDASSALPEFGVLAHSTRIPRNAPDCPSTVVAADVTSKL